MTPKYFKSKHKKFTLPVFFPDATRAVLRTLDSTDIKNTKTEGILVNTYHLYKDLGKKVIKKHKDIRGFMNWDGGVISDSGGFQVMTLAKSAVHRGKITDEGVVFRPSADKKTLFTPKDSIDFQFSLMPDMVIVLDDFTAPNSSYEEARETVERTILWAKKSKEEYQRQCELLKLGDKNRPYLLAVVQGGEFLDLRAQCTKRLAEIGFDGFGYGGWPIKADGSFDYEAARIIKENTPEDYLLYGLGVGKPQEIVSLVDMGYHIFDCVLPTRDARHKRLYVYDFDSIKEIDVRKENFYSFYTPDKEKYYTDTKPVSRACDCLLCKNYTRSYFSHLFKIKEITALRLATIHNLRFYSILMEKLKEGTV